MHFPILGPLGPSAEMCRGFLLNKFWRILPGIFLEDFSGHFCHKNEEKKSGNEIREKIRQLRVKNLRKVRSVQTPTLTIPGFFFPIS